MRHNKDKLLEIAERIEKDDKITIEEMEYISSFKKLEKDSLVVKILKNSALPLSLFLGFLIAVYPEYFEDLVAVYPEWTNLSPRLLAGVDYLWDIIGDPVGKQNIIYHIPNIVLYSFGVIGVKKLFDALNKRTWINNILDAQTRLNEDIDNGTHELCLAEGHSVLFVGNGDFIGKQFVLDHDKDMAVTISKQRPSYTKVWNYYDKDLGYEELKQVLTRIAGEKTGEYIFFPVVDDQIFLPGANAYDLSPHRLDIFCQDLRNIEQELDLHEKRIIIVGDKYHHSFVRSEDINKIIRGSSDTISLEEISNRYSNTTLIDPTDIAMKRIVDIAKGRKIVFRATKEGIKEYKKRFYERLKEVEYKQDKRKKGVLTIGYDIFEDLTEQQSLAGSVDDYCPVVLSTNVRDALVRNGYKRSEFLYVPELVLKHLKKIASEQ